MLGRISYQIIISIIPETSSTLCHCKESNDSKIDKPDLPINQHRTISQRKQDYALIKKTLNQTSTELYLRPTLVILFNERSLISLRMFFMSAL